MKRILVVAAVMSMVLGSASAWAQLPHHSSSGDHETPRTITVNCDRGKTIGQSLQRANPGDTIQITGTCQESLVITTDDLTLDGQGTTTIDGGGTTVMTIDGARRVVIQGLTVRHGVEGILAQAVATITVQSVTAEDNTLNGLSVSDKAVAQVTDCTAQRNGADGIATFRSGLVRLGGTIVSHANKRAGLSARTDGFIDIVTGATVMVDGNTGWGILVNTSATLDMVGGGAITVQNNGDVGISVADHSMLRVLAGTVTSMGNNAAGGNTAGNGGIEAFRSSAVRFAAEIGPLTVQISDNHGHGISFGQTSTVRVISGTLDIFNNTGRGINVSNSGALVLSTGTVRNNQGDAGINLLTSIANLTNVTVTSNDGNGIVVGSSNDLQMSGTSSVTNNGNTGVLVDGGQARIANASITGNKTDINASFGALLEVNGGSVGTITCDTTVLSRGSTMCP
jgi:hypothetical protein